MAQDSTSLALTQQLQGNPQFQAWVRTQTHLNPREALKNPQAQAMAAQLGIPIPPGYHVSLNGLVAKDDSIGSFLKQGALMAGATLAAGLGIPHLTGGNASDGSATDPGTDTKTASDSHLGSDLLNFGIDTGGGLLKGLGESLLQQKRQSYKGTANDPGTLLSHAGGQLDAFGAHLAAQPPPDLSGLNVATPPAFAGGGLPMPIGIQRRTAAPSAGGSNPQDLQQLQAALGILKGGR